MIIRLLGSLGRSGGNAPRIIDTRRDSADSDAAQGSSARHAPFIAVASVSIVLLLVVLDFGARGEGARSEEPQGLGARDHAALTKAEKDCFERLGPNAEWRLLDRCRATEVRESKSESKNEAGR